MTFCKSGNLRNSKTSIGKSQFDSFIKIWIINFKFIKDGINRRKQHPTNDNDCFFVPATLFERKIARFDFRVLMRTTDGKLKVRYNKSIMSAVFLTGRKIRKFGAVAHEIAKLSSFKRRDKVGNDKVV